MRAIQISEVKTLKRTDIDEPDPPGPGQALVKVVHEELVHVMGDENAALDLNAAKPVVVLVAGLQGSGKTTTTGKLARHLINDLSKKVMVVSCDVYRPAAIEQLRTLADQVGAIFSP